MENIGKIYDKAKRDEQRQLKNKRNILIAEKVREVLKSKMLINQKIIASSKLPDCLSLDEFTKKLREIVNKLEVMEKDDPKRDILEREYCNFIELYSGKVILKEYEIDELLTYVKGSIVRFGIPRNKFEYTNNELVKYSLLMLNNLIISCCDEEDKELGKWVDFICSSSEAGFYKNSELYQLKSFKSKYFTIRENHKTIYSIDADANVSINEDINPENSLLIDNLYLGYVNLRGKRVVTILSKREGYYYPIFFDYKCDNYTEVMQKRSEQDVEVIIPFSSALKFQKLSHLIEPLYDKMKLEYIAMCMSEPSQIAMSYLVKSGNKEIPSDELYVFKTDKNYYEVIHKSANGKDIPPAETVAKLNEILEYVGLHHLIEDSYDPKKLEYILVSIQEDYKIPKIITEDNKPNVTLHL